MFEASMIDLILLLREEAARQKGRAGQAAFFTASDKEAYLADMRRHGEKIAQLLDAIEART
jgi:hypothetical protein